jgi:hypothetical protein
VARRACAVTAACMIEANPVVERDIEQGLLLAVIFVRELAVLKLNDLSLGKERNLDRIFSGRIHRCGATAFCFLVCHEDSKLQGFRVSMFQAAMFSTFVKL